MFTITFAIAIVAVKKISVVSAAAKKCQMQKDETDCTVNVYKYQQVLTDFIEQYKFIIVNYSAHNFPE